MLGFEGDSATPLRWRVAQILKRAGHTVVGFAPPRSDSASALSAYATRRRVDVFVAGSAVEGGDGWELSLTVRDSEGSPLGSGLTFTAPTLGGLVKELKSDGQGRLDRVVRGGADSGSRSSKSRSSKSRSDDSSSSNDIDLDETPVADGSEGDLARELRARSKKKTKASVVSKSLASKKSKRAVEPVDLDEDPAPEEPAVREEAPAEDEPREAEQGSTTEVETPKEAASADATGWSTSDSAPSDDDGSAAFLSGDSAGSDAEEVGADDGGSSADSAAVAGADPTVVLGVNAGLVRRTLEYVDDLYGRLRAPNANAWVYQLKAAVYPFAKPIKNRLGLIASYESAFSGVVRDNTAGTDFGVTFSELFGGVRFRQPLGKHELGLEGSVGAMQAGLDDPDATSGVPEYSYTLLRGSADLGLHFGALSMRGSLGYRLPIGGYGEVSEVDFFPRMQGYGIEAVAGLEYRFTNEVSFDVSGSMRRFVLQMNSRPEDARDGVSEVAGGAIDLYLSGYFGLNITL